MTNIVATLYGTTFGIVSLRAGKHWALSEEESKVLAEPTIALLKESGLLDKLEKNAAWAMLAIAVSSIIVPRAMVSFAQYQATKQHKEEENKNVVLQRQQQQQQQAARNQQSDSRTSETNGGQPTSPSASSVPSDGAIYTGSGMGSGY